MPGLVPGILIRFNLPAMIASFGSACVASCSFLNFGICELDI